MPELPDLTVYIETIGAKTIGVPLERARVASPFLVRTVDPPLRAVEGARVLGLRRVGKRIVFALEGDLFLVVHLMISGRFKWRERNAPIPKKLGLAAFDFPKGTLLFTEASTKKRASLHVVRGEAALRALDPGGIEPLQATEASFAEALRRESHTLKRSLTDPHLFAGIGNAYSDEILHRARLSPTRLTRQLGDAEITRLLEATRAVLVEWTSRLREESGGEVPEKVTAFHDEMAVHGRYGKPCPVCGAKVQRIVHASNESNYCARCQTGGKLLADRALSRLLREDWPRSLEELDDAIARRASPSAPEAKRGP
jgi:formamidopyrimidine-DNA glycosylase